MTTCELLTWGQLNAIVHGYSSAGQGLSEAGTVPAPCWISTACLHPSSTVSSELSLGLKWGPMEGGLPSPLPTATLDPSILTGSSMSAGVRVSSPCHRPWECRRVSPLQQPDLWLSWKYCLLIQHVTRHLCYLETPGSGAGWRVEQDCLQHP